MATNSVFVNLFGSGGGVSPVNPSLFPNGSAAAPSISFINDPQSGRYLIGTNNVGESINGILRFDWNASRFRTSLPIQLPNGSAANPALVFENSNTSGLYRIGADNIGFSAGGTLRFDYNGTRINTTIPIYAADGANAAPSYSFASGTSSGMRRITAGPVFEANGNSVGGFTSASGHFILGLGLGSGNALYWVNTGNFGSSGALITSLISSSNRVLICGPTTGIRLDWSTDGTLRVLNFAGSADGIVRAASFNANGTAGVTAGPFTTVTSIQTIGGIVTTLTGT